MQKNWKRKTDEKVSEKDLRLGPEGEITYWLEGGGGDISRGRGGGQKEELEEIKTKRIKGKER